MALLNELESLRIPFGDIKEATKNFTTVIGKGGYGLVYKGELLLSGKLTTVAVKRLDGNNISGQGFKEFLTEIQLLTRYKHPNLISLMGVCNQDNEKILIYEHAEHGSLDKYLSTAENRYKLTWKQRINICVNAARGLNYLHNEVATNERVIHRDIKSSNVLLDRNWKAMISDLGLSKLGRANERDTFLITNASGTHGYCDPAYISLGILTKESDVYSFGVVLIEVLCGRLCFINVNNEHRFLPPLAQRYCKIDEIMYPALKNQIDSDSLNKFSKIASQCLQNNRKRRPSMRTVVKKLEELEKASEFQQRQDTDQLLNKTQAGMDPDMLHKLKMAQLQQQQQQQLKMAQLQQYQRHLKVAQQQQLKMDQQKHRQQLKLAQVLQQQQQNGNQQQQQQQHLQHSLSAPLIQNLNLNVQQDKILGTSSVTGDGSMSNSFRGNDQAGRKRKQPVLPSITAFPHNIISSKPVMMGFGGPTTLTSLSNQLWDDKDFVQADMDRFVEDGSLDGDGESFFVS